MVLGDGQGLPLGVRLESATPAEVMLVDATLEEVRVPQAERSAAAEAKVGIADRGYDSDRLVERWKRRGIELIAPYRKNNKEGRYEDAENCDATMPLDHRAHQRLAWTVPPIARSS